MPYKKPEIKKVYYTIGEVSALLGVNASLIRFWEKEFDILKLRKNNKGNRLFTKSDIDNLRMLYHLVKEKGYTLQGARDVLRKNSEQTGDKEQLLRTLLEMRKFVTELLTTLPQK